MEDLSKMMKKDIRSFFTLPKFSNILFWGLLLIVLSPWILIIAKLEIWKKIVSSLEGLFLIKEEKKRMAQTRKWIVFIIKRKFSRYLTQISK